MKKILLTLCCVILAFTGINAQEHSKFQSNVEIGVGPMFSSAMDINSVMTMNYDYIAGARLNQHVFIGGATGLHTQSLYGMSIPIYANFKYYFKDNDTVKVNPLLSCSLGANLMLNDGDCLPGVLLNISGGGSCKLSRKMDAYSTLGIELFTASGEVMITPVLRVGIAF